MNTNTAVRQSAAGLAGVMVRSGTSLYVYWQCPGAAAPIHVILTDLSGRPARELLDGTGARQVAVPAGQTGAYLHGLPPGHLFGVAIRAADGAELFALGPVQTPGTGGSDAATFPAPYHRS